MDGARGTWPRWKDGRVRRKRRMRMRVWRHRRRRRYGEDHDGLVHNDQAVSGQRHWEKRREDQGSRQGEKRAGERVHGRKQDVWKGVFLHSDTRRAWLLENFELGLAHFRGSSRQKHIAHLRNAWPGATQQDRRPGAQRTSDSFLHGGQADPRREQLRRIQNAV